MKEFVKSNIDNIPYKLNYKLPKENKIKIIMYLNITSEKFVNDNEFINKINKSFVNTQWKIYVNQIHALHFLYFDDIINSIIQ